MADLQRIHLGAADEKFQAEDSKADTENRSLYELAGYPVRYISEEEEGQQVSNKQIPRVLEKVF